MKSKSIFLMAVSLGFGLVAAIGITQVMGRSNEQAPTKQEPKLPVLVALQDIDINDELLPEMFSEEEWPARLVPEGVATAFEELDGMVTTARIGKKNTVSILNLLEKSKLREKKIPFGHKVVGIKLGADDHLNGLLEAGDLVDIMIITRGKSRTSSAGSSARTFLRKITVWSMGSKTKKDIEQTSGSKGSTVVGLLVTERQAEKIVLAEEIADLKLAMRGKEDIAAADRSEGTSSSDLQNGNEGPTSAMAQMLTQLQQPPIAASNELPADTWTMTVHTGAGPTQYHFDKNAGMVPRRIEGFTADPVVPVEEVLDVNNILDFDDDDVDDDSDLLIEELDSEPNS